MGEYSSYQGRRVVAGRAVVFKKPFDAWCQRQGVSGG